MTPGDFLTPAQVAEEMQVTVVTVRRWIAGGELRAAKAGPRKWRIRRSDLESFLSSGARNAAPQASEDPSFRTYLVVPGER
jgi:excisionase family DNA binding protein